MLRASIDTHEQSVNLDAVMSGNVDSDKQQKEVQGSKDLDNALAEGHAENGEGTHAGPTLIEHAAELVAFATSTVNGTEAEIAAARTALTDAAGAAAMVDAAGVASNFQRMVRIADSTGIELGEAEVAATSAEVRHELDIEQFRSNDKRYF